MRHPTFEFKFQTEEIKEFLKKLEQQNEERMEGIKELLKEGCVEVEYIIKESHKDGDITVVDDLEVTGVKLVKK